MASQHQIQQLTERYNELAQSHVTLLQQIVQLQKFVKNHEGVMQRVMGFLHSVDALRRSTRIGYEAGMGNRDLQNDSSIDDHVASPLQEAAELLGEFSAENLPNKELERMTNNFQIRNGYLTTSNDSPANSLQLQTSGHSVGYLGNDLENMVYPVGSTNGIDPIHSEHINNIPYAPPPSMLHQTTISEMVPDNSNTSKQKKRSVVKSLWGEGKPNILLVEDDKVCARIGTKFLQAFDCGVETAVSPWALSEFTELTSQRSMEWKL